MTNEQGNVTLVALPGIVLFALCLLIAFEAFGTYIIYAQTNEALRLARQASFNTGFLLQLKNSNEPEEDISELIVTGLRNNGVSGEIQIYVVEASRDETSANTRALAYCVEVHPSNDNQDIMCSISASITPYAKDAIWRPSDAEFMSNRVKCLVFADGSDCTNKYELSLSNAPQALQRALEKAIEQAQERK